MSVDNLSQTLPLHWAYLNEGRAAAVFSYRGPLDSPFAHKVLRLRKSSSSDPGDDPDNDPIIAFHSSLISRLFIPDLLPRYHLLAVDHEWLTSFAAYHDPSRPPDRRATAGIDLFRHSAVLADDLVSTYPCSFEIKPKWGFLPSPSLLSPETAPIKTQTCRTCMHDHLRRTTAAATEAGLERPAGPDTVKLGFGSSAPDLDPEPNYCALDLFSRDPARVRRAVRALWAIWTSDLPTNKLRIFARGRMLDPTDHQGVVTWATETWGALKPQTLDAVKTEEAVCDTLADALLRSGVLTRLADLQRMFDPLDIEGLARLRDAVPGETPPILDEPTLEEWHATVDRMLERARATAEDGDLIQQADAETWRFYARAYMLSATLRDCSIFVALPDGGGDPIVKLVDLDPKSVAKFGYWEQLDEEVVDAYREVEEGKRKVCVDDRSGVDEGKAGKAGK